MNKNKEFDVVIWGATGFTGRLVAEYYLRHYGLTNKFKWAMATGFIIGIIYSFEKRNLINVL